MSSRFSCVVLLMLCMPPVAMAGVTGIGPVSVRALGSVSGLRMSQGRAVSDLGLVAGVFHFSTGASTACADSGGVVANLGAMGGYASSAEGVNNQGQVVGYTLTTQQGPTQAFIYQNGSMTNLGTLPGATNADHQAFAINSNGVAVGLGRPSPSGGGRAVVFSNGQVTSLGTLGGDHSIAYDINDGGQIVGVSQIASVSVPHAFRYQSNQMQDLGTLPGGQSSAAEGINNHGHVVGWSGVSLNGPEHAFLHDGTMMRDLGVLTGDVRSQALDINDAGFAVGFSQSAGGLTSAVVFDGQQVIDLNALIPAGSGWRLTVAHSISDTGFVTGEGVLNGQARGFLLSGVPAPSSGAMAVAIGICVLRRRRR